MSHWTRHKTKVTDEETLVKALTRMGAKSVATGNKVIKQYGQSETASVWIDDAVGFHKEADGTYSMIGDFYHSRTGFSKYYGNVNKFQQDLGVAYAIEDAASRLDELGFEITENYEGKVGSDGLIRMEAVCWA